MSTSETKVGALTLGGAVILAAMICMCLIPR